MTFSVSPDPFVLAGRTVRSRLLVGTGKYADLSKTRANPICWT